MGAMFSNCRRYRYVLWRDLGETGPRIMWLMLNPSTADAVSNDPTVERCERRAAKMGASRMVVCNIFALRSTDPKGLRDDSLHGGDPIGAHNDATIQTEAVLADKVICAWGMHGRYLGRGRAVAGMLHRLGIPLYALQVTASGHPSHPLYLAYQLQPSLWVPNLEGMA